MTTAAITAATVLHCTVVAATVSNPMAIAAATATQTEDHQMHNNNHRLYQ